MKPRAFDYIAPGSVAEAVEALAARGEAARVLAGGQSLVAMLNFRLFEPARSSTSRASPSSIPSA